MKLLLPLIVLSLLVGCSHEEQDWYWKEKHDCFKQHGRTTYDYSSKILTCHSLFEPKILYTKKFEKRIFPEKEIHDGESVRKD
jgi:hypothetical protein